MSNSIPRRYEPLFSGHNNDCRAVDREKRDSLTVNKGSDQAIDKATRTMESSEFIAKVRGLRSFVEYVKGGREYEQMLLRIGRSSSSCVQ